MKKETKKKQDREDRRSKKNKKSQDTHEIKSGETISQIAKKYGVSEEQLLKANNLDKKSAKNIRPGQKIKVDNNKSSKNNNKSTKKSKKSKKRRR
jgi:LysM repeat protein